MPEAPRTEAVSTAVRALAIVVGSAVGLAAILLAAGRLDWPRGWTYVALLAAVQTASASHVRRHDPELSCRRGRPGTGTKGWDMALLGLFGLTWLAAVLVACLDVREAGSSPAPLWLWPIGAALHVLGTALFTWAMRVNTHFEKTVRIQSDRGHRVIESGPYRFVRHPGYVGASLAFPLATPLLLGSWRAWIPAVICVGSLLIRTVLEDRLLWRELPGYGEYARHVRSRWIPRIW